MRIRRFGAARSSGGEQRSAERIVVPRSAVVDRTVLLPPVDPCAGMLCPPNTNCINGACIPYDPCGGVVCPPPLSCRDGACVDLSCVGVSCPPGSLCRDGACVPGQSTPLPSTQPRVAETIVVPVSATRSIAPRDMPRSFAPVLVAPSALPLAPRTPIPVPPVSVTLAPLPAPRAAAPLPAYTPTPYTPVDPGPAPEPEPEVPQTHSQPTDADVVPVKAGSPLGWAVGLFFLGKALSFF